MVLFAVFAFVFGTLIGSFLNVCIGRLPAGQSIVRPRSRCPHCSAQIAAYDNIPIVSWLLLRARCRACGAPISIQYPLVELATGLLWVAAFVVYGPSFLALRMAVFATLLLGIAVTDAREFLIPDGFTVFGLVWVLGTSTAGWAMTAPGPFASPGDALIGACAGAGAVAIIGWLGELVFRREAMGFGDVTLMAVIGAAVGPTRALLTIFLGALIAVIVILLLLPFGIRERITPSEETPSEEKEDTSRHIPFGVFLAPAALVALVWGDAMIQGYVQWVLTGSFN